MAKKFQQDEKYSDEDVDTENKPVAVTPPRRRGRPPKNKETAAQVPQEPLPEMKDSVSNKKCTEKATLSSESSTRKTEQSIVLATTKVTSSSLVSVSAPPPGVRLVPCQPPKHLLKKVKPPPVKNGEVKQVSGSLFDIEDTETHDDILGKVQKALEKQNSAVDKKADLIGEAPSNTPGQIKMSKPSKTFTRIPKKLPVKDNKEITLVNHLDIETVVVPEDTSIDIQTLSMATFETEDPDFALVKKLGAGVQKDHDTVDLATVNSALMTSSLSANKTVKNDNSVVFHVANNTMTTQPTECNNLEVKEQGQTKVLLTAGSDLIEVHDLKKTYQRQNTFPLYGRGRGRGRGKDTLTRFMEKESIINNTFGNGWFMWSAC